MSENTQRLYENIEGIVYEIQFDDSAQSENWRQGVDGINWDAAQWVEFDGTKFVQKQRYEQLEQVSKKMLKHIGWCLSHHRAPWSGYYKEFKDALRECGVSLDD